MSVTVKVNDASVSDLLRVSVSKSVTKYTGSFKFAVDNAEGAKTGDFQYADDVKIYFDDVLVLRGRVEDVKHTREWGERIEVSGRDYTARLLDRVVNESYSSTNIKTIVTDLIQEYVPDISTSNVQDPGETWSGEFRQRRLLYALQELADVVGYQLYVDTGKDLHFEPKETTDSGYTLSTGSNIVKYDFPDVGKQVYNRVWVYGAEDIAVMREDKQSQQTWGFIRDKVISDPSISSKERARERAGAELSQWANPLQTGEIETYGLFDLEPGMLVTVNIPSLNIENAKYVVLDVDFSVPPQVTRLRVAEWRVGFEAQLAELMRKTEELSMIHADLEATVEWWNSLEDQLRIVDSVTVWVRDAGDKMEIGSAVIGESRIGDRSGSWEKWYEA